jgi:hypothetical protein
MFTVKVVHKNYPGSTYCGRPSPLGNPFVMKTEADRETVCEQYELWFQENLETLKPYLRNLWRLGVESGELLLGCWCAPKRCHLETVKNFFESQMNLTRKETS